jgi:hypothetical protein
MRKYYQTDWQGIQLASIAPLSSRSLPGSGFYQAFYDEFFSRYSQWTDLSAEWRQGKERCAAHVMSMAGQSGRLLSIGCGIGYMEHCLRSHCSHYDLFIHEVASSAWKWIGSEVPDDRKLLGFVPQCLPSGVTFDLIYLSAVDYAFDDEALVALLSAVRPLLRTDAGEHGKCLIISASYEPMPTTVRARLWSWLRRGKALVAAGLDRLGIRPRGQFWGWLRTREEYRALMQRAGLTDITDGFVDSKEHGYYWIAGG